MLFSDEMASRIQAAFYLPGNDDGNKYNGPDQIIFSTLVVSLLLSSLSGYILRAQLNVFYG